MSTIRLNDVVRSATLPWRGSPPCQAAARKSVPRTSMTNERAARVVIFGPVSLNSFSTHAPARNGLPRYCHPAGAGRYNPRGTYARPSSISNSSLWKVTETWPTRMPKVSGMGSTQSDPRLHDDIGPIHDRYGSPSSWTRTVALLPHARTDASTQYRRPSSSSPGITSVGFSLCPVVPTGMPPILSKPETSRPQCWNDNET